MSTNQLLLQVKDAGEDFEWYPTTRQMLEVVARDIRSELDGRFSILDIGAGNGSSLKTLCELTENTGDKYAIEKSRLLLDSLPDDVFVVGTDFYQQTLIDKRVDVVFCNPPYSDFATWMHRIVAEANCQLIYLVVPQRWKEDRRVVDMIERRCNYASGDRDCDAGSHRVLDSASFVDSEYRRARAQVDILKVKLKTRPFRSDEPAVDPFDVWFEGAFAINADKATEPTYEEEQATAQRLHSMVVGQNVVERLEEIYRVDFDKLLGTYRELEKLDRSLFKELGVDLPKVREGLKSKIKGLKSLYWQELFSSLDTITSRLTSSSRTALLDKLTAHTSIDFTADNAYAVVLWAIKNANAYFDRQLLAVYRELSNQENIRNYKSNQRIPKDNWRYLRDEPGHSHYALDYRLVINRWSCFNRSEFGDYDYPNGLHKDVHTLLNDLCTIGQNLGFRVVSNSLQMRWSPGDLREFRCADGSLLMDVRAFKKGTIHVRLNQEFMRRLNVEAGRLNGWIKSPAEAREEMGFEAEDVFGSNFKLTSVPLLAAPAPVRDAA